MFDNLIESKPKKTQNGRQFMISMVVHAVLIAAMIWVTKGAAETVQRILADTTLVFIAPPKETPPPPDQPPPDAVVSANPPPQGFQVVLPPDVVPQSIPPVDLNQRFDARDFTGKGVEGGPGRWTTPRSSSRPSSTIRRRCSPPGRCATPKSSGPPG